MYDWEEFKDIENKPKKMDILIAFLYSYMVACKINQKIQEEKKSAKAKTVIFLLPMVVKQ